MIFDIIGHRMILDQEFIGGNAYQLPLRMSINACPSFF